MPSSKREQAQTERRLVATLTQACETAKSEVIGFCWLTHEIDYSVFPSSLKVVWVFDTLASKDQALADGLGERMVALTAQALSEADVSVTPVADHVLFDSEEQCQREHAGNWQQRLTRKHARRG
jgi:hypothetical protein